MSSAKSFTLGFVVFSAASLPASISMVSAVTAIIAIWGSVGGAADFSWAAKAMVAARATQVKASNIGLSW